MKLILTLLLLASVSAYSQTSNSQFFVPVTAEAEEDYTPYEVVIKKNNSYTPGYLNNIPAAILSEFTNDYEGAKNVSWFVDDMNTTVYFAYNDEINVVKYQQDGLVLLKRKTYAANKITPVLSNFLQEEAKGYEIRYVNESIRDHAHHYEINLVKDQQWLVLKIDESKAGQFVVTGRKSFN